jgi:hypothetical protein
MAHADNRLHPGPPQLEPANPEGITTVLVASGLDNDEVIELLKRYGLTLADATHRMLFALVHGAYTSKRYNVIFDAKSSEFVVVIRRRA